MKGRPCHLSAARGRTGSAAGWRWVGGACWAAIKSRELASFVYWYTKARKSVLRSAAGPNLSLDQVWISSRPHDGCWPVFLLFFFCVSSLKIHIRRSGNRLRKECFAFHSTHVRKGVTSGVCLQDQLQNNALHLS